ADQLFEQLLLFAAEKAKQRKRVFTHVGMNVEGHIGAQRRQCRKRGNTDVDFVSHACSFHHSLVGMFRDQPSSQVRYHFFLSLRSTPLEIMPSAEILLLLMQAARRPWGLAAKSRSQRAPAACVSVWLNDPSRLIV